MSSFYAHFALAKQTSNLPSLKQNPEYARISHHSVIRGIESEEDSLSCPDYCNIQVHSTNCWHRSTLGPK